MKTRNKDRNMQSIPDDPAVCQIRHIDEMSTGHLVPDNNSLAFQFMLARKRFLGYETRHALRKYYNRTMKTINRLIGKQEKPKEAVTTTTYPTLNLQAGDLVRIRPYEEIKAMLDERNDYKGCGYMTGMKQYCGTTHRVLKPVRRFVDERDHRLKKSSGVVLLEGLICQGDDTFGPCDRSCFFFWREEWLEKVEEEQPKA